jgi:putative Ca2+/H+ antiporter (TMEM165/GDT1 family)
LDFTVIAVAFTTIFVVELPDKTFVAALVLSTRYRPILVWLGIGTAFLVQSAVAVTAGSLVTLLPETVVKVVAAAVFLIGAIVLIRTAPKADTGEHQQEEEYAERASVAKSGFAAVAASFVVIFAAEWGDLSQLLTISLVARYHEPLSVLLGAWTALLTVSGLAILSGRFLLQHLRLATVHYVGAAVCLVLVAVTLYEVLK